MPPTPIPVGYGIATARYVRSGDPNPLVTTFGFRNVGAASALAAATSISTDWSGNFTAGITLNDYTYEALSVLLNTSGGPQAYVYTANIVGTVAADPVSPAIAVRVTKQTLYAGRKFRGRMYLPPALLAEANVNAGGVIDAGTIASIQSAATGLLGDLVTSGYPMVLLHHDLSTPNDVASLEVRSTVGTQRRRQALS